jgi:hypothetical protein
VSGCYRYVPVDIAAIRPTEDVRVQVTESAAVRLVKEFGTYLTALEGRVSREGTDSLSITVPIGRDYRGVSLEGGRQVLFLGRSEVVGLRRREFSRGRTLAVSAGALVVFGALVAAVTQWSDPNSSVVEPPPPPPPAGAIVIRFGIP